MIILSIGVKNMETKKRILFTILRQDNLTNVQYERAINMLMTIDSKLAQQEIDRQYIIHAASLGITPDLKKVG